MKNINNLNDVSQHTKRKALILGMVVRQLETLRRRKIIAMKGNNILNYCPNVIWKGLLPWRNNSRRKGGSPLSTKSMSC
jgi:hypothetical protein